MDTSLVPSDPQTPVPSSAPVATPPRASVNRFGMRWMNYLRTSLSASPSKRRLAYGALQIGPIRHWEKQYAKLSDKEILQVGAKLKGRARGGESLDVLLPEVFGLVSEAAWRNVSLRPYDVQLA